MLLQGLEVGGLEKIAVDLVNGLPNRYKTTICCYDSMGPLKDCLNESIEIIYLKRKEGFNPKYFIKLAKEMKKRKIDVLHMHNKTAFFYGTIAAKLAGINKTIYTEHGRTEKIKKKTKIAFKILNRFITETIVVTDYIKNYLLSNEGFRAERVTVIPNGINITKDEPKKNDNALYEELGISENTMVVGIVARLDPIKNHKMLLKAFKIAVNKHSNIKLIIVGDGSLRGELENLAKKYMIRKKVIFLGERKDIIKILGCIDVFVLCSKSEGMSITLLEAMASGVPIIATRVGGNSSIIENGVSGILVESNEHIELAKEIVCLIKDDQKRKEISRAAKDRYEREFTLDKMVERYCFIFEKK